MSGTKTLVLMLVVFAGALSARADDGSGNGTTLIKAGRLIDVAASRARALFFISRMPLIILWER